MGAVNDQQVHRTDWDTGSIAAIITGIVAALTAARQVLKGV